MYKNLKSNDKFTGENSIVSRLFSSVLSVMLRRKRSELSTGNCTGRSMIEMLGVLAIIAVLTVGGIAGYSKAMEKFKINKMIDEYSYLINGLLEYKDNLIKSNPAEGSIKLYDFILAANLVPPSWTTENTWAMTDTVGNTVVPYLNNQEKFMVLDVHLHTTGKGIADFAYNSCVTLFKDIAKPLSQNFVGIFAGSSATSVHYNGSLYCHNGKNNTKCLSDMSLPEIDEACKKCLNGKSDCMVTMVW